jgi:heme exporter protein C
MNRPNWFRYASPRTFDPLAARLVPLFAVSAVLLIVAGLAIGLAAAPRDALQGDV